jgi:RimJ/RimL family protein N-acetyltransferase
MKIIFETPRLEIYKASPVEADVDILYRLWSEPRVMVNVGYPQGLGMTREQIRRQLEAQGESELNAVLLVRVKETGRTIGEAWLGEQDADGVSETDVKLLPEAWGNKYGIEVKRGLVGYLFEHTDCQCVQATPNVNNAASIRMQEAVGAKRVGESTFHPPHDQRERAIPVHSYIYRVCREDFIP